MASKYRPKGSISDLLNLDASAISAMSDRELRQVVNKLNDAANKRLKRLKEKGISGASQAYYGRKGKNFSTKGATTTRDLKNKLQEAKAFLESKTSTIQGTKKSMTSFESITNDLRARAMESSKNLDKRYKEPRLKKSAEKEALTDFWTEYNSWRELMMAAKPDKFKKGGTNQDTVQEFYENYYDTDWKEALADEYEEEEEEEELDEDFSDLLEEEEEEDEPSNEIPTKPSKRRGKSTTKQDKLQSTGVNAKPKTYGKTTSKNGIKQRFEKIKIF